jgi:arabinofuranosyltransferase
MRARVLWPFTVDDTYITLQYARHLAEGHGPAWNVGGPPAEGYTTVLWMLLLSVPELCGIDGVLAAKSMSALCGFGAMGLSAWLAYTLARRCTLPARVFAAGAVLAAFTAYWKPAVHAVSGMETCLAALLMAGFGLCLARFAERPTRALARGAAVSGLLLVLARPECVVVPGLALPLAYVRADAAARALLVRAVLASAVLPGGLYYAARSFYFGLPFPLPFYVKAQGHGRFAGVADVLAFFGDFVRERPFVPVLAITGAVVARASAGPLCAGALGLALFFTVPSHIMGFESRYLMPLVPVLFALYGAGAAVLVAQAEAALFTRLGAAWARTLAHGLAWLVLVPVAAVSFPAGYATQVSHWRGYGDGLDHAHLALAADLRDHEVLAPARTIALLDVGAVAYGSNFRVIDTYGLNDRAAALSRRTDVAYVFAQRPDLVVAVSERPDRLVAVFPWEVPIVEAAEREHFRPVASYPFEHDYHLRVYARDGSPLAKALAAQARGWRLP